LRRDRAAASLPQRRDGAFDPRAVVERLPPEHDNVVGPSRWAHKRIIMLSAPRPPRKTASVYPGVDDRVRLRRHRDHARSRRRDDAALDRTIVHLDLREEKGLLGRPTS